MNVGLEKKLYVYKKIMRKKRHTYAEQYTETPRAVQFILLTNANPAALSPSLSDSLVISITRTLGYRVIHN